MIFTKPFCKIKSDFLFHLLLIRTISKLTDNHELLVLTITCKKKHSVKVHRLVFFNDSHHQGLKHNVKNNYIATIFFVKWMFGTAQI